ncbi:MAG: pyridoxal-phosphate dependent enzyme [Bacteroidota bacterium]
MATSFTTKDELLDVQSRIAPYLHRTPVLTSQSINEIVGVELFFKCENFQKMGAFKMRGAAGALSAMSDSDRVKGVVTHSSGNFAQAVALSAKMNNVPAYIVMPENAPAVKKAAVRGYGATIIEVESTQQAREAGAAKVGQETGATFAHPSNQIEVILGNATAGMELFEEISDLDAVFTPVGGGGLLAGTALATKHFSPKTKVFGGEPMGADDAWRSLQAGHIIPMVNPDTIADGLRTSLGDVNFPIIQELVEEIIRVEEDEIVAAMRLVWERMKIIIEPSCAVPVAAVIKQKERFTSQRIGIIITGGNVDLGNLPF